jgi:hypothetical protein
MGAIQVAALQRLACSDLDGSAQVVAVGAQFRKRHGGKLAGEQLYLGIDPFSGRSGKPVNQSFQAAPSL